MTDIGLARKSGICLTTRRTISHRTLVRMEQWRVLIMLIVALFLVHMEKVKKETFWCIAPYQTPPLLTGTKKKSRSLYKPITFVRDHFLIKA